MQVLKKRKFRNLRHYFPHTTTSNKFPHSNTATNRDILKHRTREHKFLQLPPRSANFVSADTVEPENGVTPIASECITQVQGENFLLFVAILYSNIRDCSANVVCRKRSLKSYQPIQVGVLPCCARMYMIR